jgi:YD repeat-containing protein
MRAEKRTTPLAPGARVLIRDEEWLVRKVDRTSNGHYALSVTGLSELVRDQEFIFLTDLDDYQTLDPTATRLVHDESPGYRASMLHIESLLRRTPPTDSNIYLGHRGAMDSVPYQLVPTLMALEQPRPRILIADAVGLGKTLEAGVLMSELIRRGRGKRILVVTLKSMLTQFQKELWTRFAIPLVRLDSVGIQRVRSRIPSNHNPFYYYDRSIISIDTLKDAREYRTYVEKAYWDIIVIDEAHNVADRGSGSLRSRLARLLSDRSDTLIMLSATPHDGRARSFASLVNMLDPTAIANPDEYKKEELEGKNLFVRRFKRDIKHQVQGAFPEREIKLVRATATAPEEDAYDRLVGTVADVFSERTGGGVLFRTVLEKALFSSPSACQATLATRIRRLEKEGQRPGDVAAMRTLHESVGRITPDAFSKYQRLLRLIREIGWTGKDARDRLVIFTERIDTLKFLAENLARDLNVTDDAIQELYGTLGDMDQQRVVDEFGRGEAKVRLLVASDVASEGINLHFQCHRMIHFDIPWSLMVFQQRNGRIDRYGQTRTPYIYYLITESKNEKIRGDNRIMELLIEKEKQAEANIGDAAAIMGVYDTGVEEKLVTEAVEGDMSKAEADEHLQSKRKKNDTFDAAFDPVALLMGEVPAMDEATSKTRDLPSLFPSDYAYLKTALQHLRTTGGRTIQVEYDDAERRIDLTTPTDLKHRFEVLPREARPENDVFILSASARVLMDEFKRCRTEDEAWPRIQYLWPLHPALDWATDKVTMSFGRQEAPVIALPRKLPADETLFVISALIPNRKGHPVLHEWFSVRCKGDEVVDVESFADTIARLDLKGAGHANAGEAAASDRAQRLVSEAVEWARVWMSERHEAFVKEVTPRLNDHLMELAHLHTSHQLQLDLKYGESRIPEALVAGKKAAEKRRIDHTFDSYRTWIKETMETEDRPYIQVVAAFAGA